MQDNPDMPPQVIPRDRWSFARSEDGQVKPDDSNIYMAAGFDKGKSYRLIYSTNHAPVVGLGHLATRDFVSFLRYGTSREINPCAGDAEYAYAFGVSQSGRFLREFLYLALNEDEENRTVFDGLIPHIAGGRRGEFNQRFGQPSSSDNLSTGNFFPFAEWCRPTLDPVSPMACYPGWRRMVRFPRYSLPTHLAGTGGATRP